MFVIKLRGGLGEVFSAFSVPLFFKHEFCVCALNGVGSSITVCRY